MQLMLSAREQNRKLFKIIITKGVLNMTKKN